MPLDLLPGDLKCNGKSQIFEELNADEEPEVTEIESLCLQCHENVSICLF